ncbi:predicted protein [Uncinocarpus reesii 1704]|uniref:DNA-directed RNA polymerase III RPC4 n=1 Tax=Uncinocarpus reesii (strain UAMH 1704) TaxID=336963 RepID=C4JUJ2_UNCRE|nr:uncharacterized protein UREG_04795 [Uncinocarpus reesii 1704]EEP79953.1 predicted protein [Uncinocarpus reesii 1704]
MPPKAAGNRQPGSRRPINVDSASSTPEVAGTLSARATPAARGGPVQRLQTLKKRTPSGSLVPLNSDGTAPKPTLKYQPKAVVRRSKEEREARERLEAERQRERISEAAATRRTAARGDRGRGRGRGRGGAFGRIAADAGGPLGSGRSGRFGVKYDQAGGKRSGIYGGGSGDVSSDEGSDYGPRFSIDQINISSDSEGETADVGKGKAPAKMASAGSRGLRPIRVERQEHVERTVDINTEASSSKSAELRRQAKEKAGKDDSLFVESDDEVIEGPADVEMVDSTAEAGPQLKEEPTDTGAGIADDVPAAIDDTGAPSIPKKAPKKTIIKDPRSLFQTKEERQEYDRYEQDIEQLKETLGNISTTDTTLGDQADDEAKVKNEAIKDERQGRLFLLQFPPMTPNLMAPSARKNDVEEATSTPATQAPESITIKAENGTATQIPLDGGPTNPPVPGKSASSHPLISATNSSLPPGRVGKLNIHKSGRATIDWGGISLELNKGSDVDFLQDAVVASDSKPGDNSGSDRKIWAMSQVSGKFVVTPDWDKLLDE